MKHKELLDTIENGSAHVTLIDYETGIVILSTIWYNLIEEKYLKRKVKRTRITDHALRLTN